MLTKPITTRFLISISILAWIGDFCNSILDVLYIFYTVELGFAPGPIGLISSTYGISYVIGAIIFGRLIDKLPHKTSLLIATGGQVVISSSYIFLIIFSTHLPNILLWILAGQVIRALVYSFFWPTIEMLYSEIAQGNKRLHERFISIFCISWSLGAAMGTSFAGIFGEWLILGGFISTTLIYGIGFLIVFFGINSNINSGADYSAADNLSNHHPKSSFMQDGDSDKSENSSSRVIWLTLTGTLVFAIISKGLLAYVPNYAVIPEGLGLSNLISGQIIFAFGIGRFLGFLVGQWIPNSFHKLIQNISIIGIFMIAMAFTKNSWLLVGELLIVGYFAGRVYYIGLEMLMKYVSHGKGSKASLFESIVGLGTVFSPFIAGWLAELNVIIPFFFFSIMAGLSALYLRLRGKSLIKSEIHLKQKNISNFREKNNT
ncbi:MAG: hypothetical protein DRO88_02320 [Promethearchaeia archaeon]|nr:MAG: hypothetical protein DRO88_02320 [Candidatus Lokiarchaeia archaeon]